MTQTQNLADKQIIKEFTKNGYMLRPESLDIVSQYLKQKLPQNQQEFLIKIVNNIKHVSKSSSLNQSSISNVIEKQNIEESIRLIENLLNNNNNNNANNKKQEKNQQQITNIRNQNRPDLYQLTNQFSNLNQNNSSVDKLILQKLSNSIIILNPFQDFPYYIFQLDGSLINENKPEKIQSDEQPQIILTEKMIQNADQKIQIFINRYNLIKEKLKKSAIFVFHTNLGSKQAQQQQTSNNFSQMIYDIGTLFGMNDKQEKYTLGIIIQIGNNYYLQDIYQKIKINLSDCSPTKGFVTLNQIVLAKGVYKDDTFCIKSISQPIIHKRKETVDIFGSLDYFGAYTKVSNLFDKLIALDLEKLQISKITEEKKFQKINNLSLSTQKYLGVLDLALNQAFDLSKSQLYSVIIIQNFVMNNPIVLQKFETLLQGMQSLEPLTYVFMGPFFSFQSIQDEQDQLEIYQSIDHFLQIISKFEKFKQTCYWIFIPSVNDIGINILPRQGLPDILVEKLKTEIPYFINASNPSRISIFGKEFLFSNVDLMKQLRRNALVKQNSSLSMSQHLIETILGQSHLYPLQMFSKPVYTQHDPSLQLLQLPNYLIFGDKYCEQFYEFLSQQENNNETAILNPGNFSKSFEFTIIYPLLQKIEKSQVPEF